MKVVSFVFNRLLKNCCRKGDPFQGSCLNTQKLILWGDAQADQARDFIEKGHLGREQEGKRTQENCLVTWLVVSGFKEMEWISRLSLANHSDSGSLLVVHIAQPRWTPARMILGGGRTRGVSFWPFLNSSGWWWLISSVFPTRTSCCKITHTNGYHGAWPGRVVSVNVFPNSTTEYACGNSNLRILQLFFSA